ncbi:MAG TPA: hypothetical protein VGJ15_01875 [Pirellulales bacterium]|jgi:hypothetical protein
MALSQRLPTIFLLNEVQKSRVKYFCENAEKTRPDGLSNFPDFTLVFRGSVLHNDFAREFTDDSQFAPETRRVKLQQFITGRANSVQICEPGAQECQCQKMSHQLI